MPKIQDRRIGEGAAQPDVTKEKGTTPVETAPRENINRNSTERPIYWPLTWRDDTLVPNRIAYRVNGRLAGLLVLALATHHAATAIEHARRIGQLLIDVKASVARGEFLPWLDENVVFSHRQAQRYMAAAQGKPLPVRKIASLPKNDTVSYLTLDDIPMPRFKAGEYLRAVAVVDDAWYDELLILPTINKAAFVCHINGPADGDQLADDNTLWTWRNNAIAIEDLRRTPLVFAFPWDRAEIVERGLHSGFVHNPFAEVLQ